MSDWLAPAYRDRRDAEVAYTSSEQASRACDGSHYLSLERFALWDEGVMIFFSKKPDQRILDTLHQFSKSLAIVASCMLEVPS